MAVLDPYYGDAALFAKVWDDIAEEGVTTRL